MTRSPTLSGTPLESAATPSAQRRHSTGSLVSLVAWAGSVTGGAFTAVTVHVRAADVGQRQRDQQSAWLWLRYRRLLDPEHVWWLPMTLIHNRASDISHWLPPRIPRTSGEYSLLTESIACEGLKHLH